MQFLADKREYLLRAVLKVVYDIGTRPVERSSVIEVGSRRPDYQFAEPKETINNVFKRGDDYYYEARG
jgi:hypothetical protein